MRLDLEEKMNAINRDMDIVQQKLQKSSKELEDEFLAHQATKNALLDEQLRNQNLASELENATKLKETTEQDLKKPLSEETKEVK